MDNNSPAEVKDSAAAESMRAQHSGEEAIAAVTAGADKGSPRVEGHAAAFEMWTDEELHARAKEVGLKGHDEMSRDQLITELEGY